MEGHGTHVNGIVGARGNNEIGVSGINWDVSLMALRAGFKLKGGGGAFANDAVKAVFAMERAFSALTDAGTLLTWGDLDSGGDR